jgi:hypothetical protein
MATFNAQSFGERGAGGGAGFPAHGARSEFETRLFPGGGASLYRITREAPDQLTLPCQGTEAQLGALYGEVGSDGELIYVGGTVTAILQAVEGAEQVLDGRDLWRWGCAFLVDWTSGGAVFGDEGVGLEDGDSLLTEGGDALVLEGG